MGDMKKETTIEDTTEEDAEETEEEEIYTLLNSSSTSSYSSSKQEIIEMNSTTSGHSSTDHCVQELIAKESPIDVKNVNVGSSTNSHQQVDHENNSDTGLSSLHTSSDDGIYEVGTLV